MMRLDWSRTGEAFPENHAVIGIGATLNQRFTLEQELGRVQENFQLE